MKNRQSAIILSVITVGIIAALVVANWPKPKTKTVYVPVPSQISQSSSSSSSSATSAAQPTVLLDLSGNGAQQTQPFTTTGDWTVTYTYDCSDYGSAGNFQFDVDNTDGSTNNDNGANELATSGGATDYYYDAGQHYLSINSECDWHVTVKG